MCVCVCVCSLDNSIDIFRRFRMLHLFTGSAFGWIYLVLFFLNL